MKQKNDNPFVEAVTVKNKESQIGEQILYNLLFSGKISLKEYLKQVKPKS